MVMPFV